jgi:predicted transcriptional regulator
MPKKTFQVQLSIAQRAVAGTCDEWKCHGTYPYSSRILLKADEGPDGSAWSDAMISAALDVGLSTVARVRQTAVQQGLEAIVQSKVPKRNEAAYPE